MPVQEQGFGGIIKKVQMENQLIQNQIRDMKQVAREQESLKQQREVAQMQDNKLLQNKC